MNDIKYVNLEEFEGSHYYQGQSSNTLEAQKDECMGDFIVNHNHADHENDIFD